MVTLQLVGPQLHLLLKYTGLSNLVSVTFCQLVPTPEINKNKNYSFIGQAF